LSVWVEEGSIARSGRERQQKKRRIRKEIRKKGTIVLPKAMPSQQGGSTVGLVNEREKENDIQRKHHQIGRKKSDTYFFKKLPLKSFGFQRTLFISWR